MFDCSCDQILFHLDNNRKADGSVIVVRYDTSPLFPSSFLFTFVDIKPQKKEILLPFSAAAVKCSNMKQAEDPLFNAQ